MPSLVGSEMCIRDRPRPHRHRRIQRRDATGNYVINEGAYLHLGRGADKRRTIPMKNKEVKSDINQRDAPQSLKNNRRRYPRCYAKRTSTMAPRPPTNIRSPPEPAKASKVLQKRSSPAALRSPSTSSPQATSAHSSTATAGVKTVSYTHLTLPTNREV